MHRTERAWDRERREPQGAASNTRSSSGGAAAPLRFITYLAPSIPEAFFRVVASHIADSLGTSFTLDCDEQSSGPLPGAPDPFTVGAADVGFLCAPSYVELRSRSPSPVRLSAAPVFADTRSGGRPVYFSDVVVPHDSRARSLRDLATSTWAVNDSTSLSGFISVVRGLVAIDGHPTLLPAGSHLGSMEAVLAGRADAAAIDSTVLALQTRGRPELAKRLRVVTSWGPFPVQPVVVRSSLDPKAERAIREAVVAMPAEVLAPFGAERFVAVTDADYPEALGPQPAV